MARKSKEQKLLRPITDLFVGLDEMSNKDSCYAMFRAMHLAMREDIPQEKAAHLIATALMWSIPDGPFGEHEPVWNAAMSWRFGLLAMAWDRTERKS